MYDLIALAHGLAVVALIIAAPCIIALMINEAIAQDVWYDISRAARRTAQRALFTLADLVHTPALQVTDHLPTNDPSTTLATAEQVRDWFVTAEHRALKRLPRDTPRSHRGQHRSNAGIPARVLLAQLRHERQPA